MQFIKLNLEWRCRLTKCLDISYIFRIRKCRKCVGSGRIQFSRKYCQWRHRIVSHFASRGITTGEAKVSKEGIYLLWCRFVTLLYSIALNIRSPVDPYSSPWFSVTFVMVLFSVDSFLPAKLLRLNNFFFLNWRHWRIPKANNSSTM